MTRLTKTLLIGLTLCSTICASSCASLLIPSVPQLENRTLRISEEGPTLEYQYEVCVKRVIGICVKSAMMKDHYDLTDPATRRKLIDMGFVARVREHVE